MPTYEYACENCGHEFEREQRITEDPIKKCPKCGKLKARRMIGGGNFILKGGGWESDLYSGASNRKAKDKGGSDGGGGGGGGDSGGSGGDTGSAGGSGSDGDSGASSSSESKKTSSTSSD